MLTEAVNPIKLREYLAAGLPVVSTPMPEVKLYSHLIEVADTAEGFVRAVESALAAGPDGRGIRAAAMTRETWPLKVALMCTLLKASRTHEHITDSRTFRLGHCAVPSETRTSGEDGPEPAKR